MERLLNIGNGHRSSFPFKISESIPKEDNNQKNSLITFKITYANIDFDVGGW
ncbi:hypothetical protein Hdeb2414_s0025g00660931 [Helianthus debilis subsp. tardiflorus]